MKIKYYLTVVLSSITLASCSFLDFDETDGLMTKEDMYEYFGRTEGMLTHVYSYMPQDFGAINGAMRDCASDDAEYGNVEGLVQIFNNGNWSAIKTADEAWGLYDGIRAANAFIKDIAEADFSRFEHQGDHQDNMKKLKYFPFEARVLRAHYFFELARRYGDIAMPLTVLSTDEANSIGKTKFADVINFIVSECTECAKNLPDSYVAEPGQQTGRITKGFAMAVKSKALLYRASALHNPDNNVELWKQSAAAALDIINTGLYQLDPKETANNVDSKELVLLRMNGEDFEFEKKNFPIRFTEGARSGNVATGTFPTQDLVDAFQTVNGYPVRLTNHGWESADPDFDPAQPYANRDPRFYRAVLANGMTFKGETLECYEGGMDYAEVVKGGSPTGYYLRKYIQESASFEPEHNVKAKHHWVIYRYAETLLTYAESMINAFGDVNYADQTYTLSALEALNQVRANAGMPAVVVCPKEEFIQHLRNEWRVEFAFEDHRFWDVRRWKIGASTQSQVSGVKIQKLSDGSFNYIRNTFEIRTWKECMNLYPIPQKELFINSNLNPQNQGW